jgi:hypothetical protein
VTPDPGRRDYFKPDFFNGIGHNQSIFLRGGRCSLRVRSDGHPQGCQNRSFDGATGRSKRWPAY